MGDNYLHTDLTDLIIKGFYAVYNKLGYGFLEKVYENAMLVELKKNLLECKPQAQTEVFYDNTKVGFYIADIVVNEKVIIEIKAAESLCDEHEAQLTNYLKATTIEVGLLLNFGAISLEFKRIGNAKFKDNPIS